MFYYYRWKFVIFIILGSLIIPSCKSQEKKKDRNNYKNTELYNFAEPKIIKLPPALDEISGIAYFPKDTSVFAIIDEDGLLYKIPLKDPTNIKEWSFDKPRDFEDLVLRDSTFYVLVSNGDLDILTFKGVNIHVDKIDFPNASKKANEFESLYYDSASNRIVLMCKDCDDDKKKQVSSYFLNDSTKEYNFSDAIETSFLSDSKGSKKEHIKPSAAAVNPVTKELYVLCSVNKILFIRNPEGKITEVLKLDPALYKQPEGMCFTPAGDLIISNEINTGGSATLLLLKNKKK